MKHKLTETSLLHVRVYSNQSLFPMRTYYRVKTCLKSEGIMDFGELEMVDSCFLSSTLFICILHTEQRKRLIFLYVGERWKTKEKQI